MTKESNENILGKIKKCLALSKSSNANEAAAALRQAQKLMSLHGISSEDIDLFDVSEFRCDAGSAKKPPQWHAMLMTLIIRTFGVHATYCSGWGSSSVKFVGINEAPEIAGYAYQVLHRQVKKDRAEHVKKQARCKPATKTRRGDLFAESWVIAASEKVEIFIHTDESNALIEQYLSKKNQTTGTLEPRTVKAKGRDHNSMNEGYRKGKQAQLNLGMNGEEQKRLGASK